MAKSKKKRRTNFITKAIGIFMLLLMVASSLISIVLPLLNAR